MTDPVTRIDSFDGQPLQVAQAASPIGEITELSGSVSLSRADGSSAPVSVGSPVFADDVLLTGANGRILIVFSDESEIGLSENGQIQLDSLVYDPSQGTGEMAVTVAQGLFSFVSGAIAKSGDEAMEIQTPVATIGIRGTTGIGYAAPEGQESYFVLLPDADGSVGEISVRNAVGEQIITAPLTAVSVTDGNTPPSSPEIVTLEELQQRFPGLAELMASYFESLDGDSDGEDGEDGTGDQGRLDPDGDDAETDVAANDDGDAVEGLGEDAEEEDIADTGSDDPAQSEPEDDAADSEIAAGSEDDSLEDIVEVDDGFRGNGVPETEQNADASDDEGDLSFTDVAEGNGDEFSDDFSDFENEFEEEFGEETLADNGPDSDIELVAGNDVGGSDDPLLDLGEAPGLDDFEEPSGEGQGNNDGPSEFFDELADAGDVDLGGGDGFDLLNGGSGSDFENDPTNPFDDNDEPTQTTAGNNQVKPTIGGLAIISTTPLPSITGSGGQTISVFAPQQATGGIQGSAAFEQLVVDLPTLSGGTSGSSPVISLGQNTEGNVLIEGSGLNLALDQIEEVNLQTGSGADTVELGSLSNTDIAQNTVILNTGAGDDVVRVKEGESVGRNLDIFGGDGNDVISGSDGDDELYGNGGELLSSSDHDWDSGASLPVFTEGQTFDASGATAASDVNLTFTADTAVTARFVSGVSATDNIVGYYKIGANGEISDVEFLFQGFGSGAAEAGDEVALNIDAGDTIGLFIFSADLGLINGVNGRFEIHDADGNPASLGDTGTQLVFITEAVDGDGNTIESAIALNGDLFHTADSSMNAGGLDAAYAGINPANGGLRLGFNDKTDLDYNDMVIELFEPADDPNTTDNDILLGQGGNDRLFGESGDDLLDGGEGIDFLFGGAGNDILIGGAGFDVLNGGEGSDIFTFNSLDDIPTGGRDVISDFEAGNDTIFLDNILSGTVLDALISGEMTISAVDSNTLEIGLGDKVIEVNIVDDGVFSLDNISTNSATA